MENRFEHNNPEEQGWGAYATPPSYSGYQNKQQQGSASQLDLCDRVRELLPALIENDGDIRPEMATAIYGHITICIRCSADYEEMKRVVTLLNLQLPVELPLDFSGIIMQRITLEIGPHRKGESVNPTQAASPIVSGESAAHSAVPRVNSDVTAGSTTFARSQSYSATRERVLQKEGTAANKTVTSAVLVGLLAFFLTSSWGRAMMSVDIKSANALLAQIAESLQRIPILGALVALVLHTLIGAGNLIESAFFDEGSESALQLALKIGLCVLLFNYARKRHQKNSA